MHGSDVRDVTRTCCVVTMPVGCLANNLVADVAGQTRDVYVICQRWNVALRVTDRRSWKKMSTELKQTRLTTTFKKTSEIILCCSDISLLTTRRPTEELYKVSSVTQSLCKQRRRNDFCYYYSYGMTRCCKSVLAFLQFLCLISA